MSSAIDLSMRAGVTPRVADDTPTTASPAPSFLVWVKAGFGFTVGAWLAALLLFVPSFLLYLRFLAWILPALFGVHP